MKIFKHKNNLPINWENIRQIVLKRDEYKCVICGISDTSLDIHHIHPKYFGGSHEVSNLISLCRRCHTIHHIDLQVKLGRRIISGMNRLFKKLISEYKNSPLYKKDYTPLIKLLTGNTKFKEGQEEIINAILTGSDVLVVRPTGGGKSFCFQLPALLADKQSLIISPLKALMRDQVQNLYKCGVPATYINGDLSLEERNSRLQFLFMNIFKLFYFAPERFRNLEASTYLIENNEYFKIPIKYLIVDEAHCIDKYGISFREDYGRISKIRNGYNNPQTLAFTATANPKVRDIIIDNLKLKNPKVFVHGFNRPNIIYHVKKLSITEERRWGRRKRYHRIYKKDPFRVKSEYLIELLSSIKDFKSLVFVRTIPECQKILSSINEHNHKIIEFCKNNPNDKSLLKNNEFGKPEPDLIKAEIYHSKLENIVKSNIQDRYAKILEPGFNILICTTAFGMGINIPDIRFIIHWSQPSNVDDYYQEIGRAGRDGKLSYAILLKTEGDESTNIALNKFSCEKIDDPNRKRGIEKRLTEELNDMMKFISFEGCKRKYLLDYFGEVYNIPGGFKKFIRRILLKKQYCCSYCDQLNETKKLNKLIKRIRKNSNKRS